MACAGVRGIRVSDRGSDMIAIVNEDEKTSAVDYGGRKASNIVGMYLIERSQGGVVWWHRYSKKRLKPKGWGKRGKAQATEWPG